MVGVSLHVRISPGSAIDEALNFTHLMKSITHSLTAVRCAALCALLLLSGLLGCGDQSQLPYMGLWSGQFVLEDSENASELKGYLQIYNEHKFQFGMRGQGQSVELKGQWDFDEQGLLRLRVQTASVEDAEMNLEETKPQRDARLAEIRKGYGHEMRFKVSEDKRQLTGFPQSLGELYGHFEFEKGAK